MELETRPARVTMQPGERRSVGLISLVGMMRMLGLFALLPVLSPYAMSLSGQTPLLIGLAVGAYGLTAAFFQIPLGALSDRIGRRPVIIAGLLVFALGGIVAALSDTIHGVILGRLLQGAGAISAALTALIADSTRDEVRTRSMAVFGVGVGLSFVLSMVAGPAIAAHFGVAAVFWTTVVLAAFGILLVFAIPDVARPAASRSWDLRLAFRSDLLRIDLYVFLLHSIMTATFVALPFLLSRGLEMSVASHWKMYISALLASLLITVPLVMRDHRQGRRRLVGVAVTLVLLGQLLLTFTGFSTAIVFVALAIYFGGFNFLEAGLPARLSVLADNAERGASLGVFATAQFLGAFAGGLIGGRFLGHGRPADVFFVCMLLAAIWLALHGLGGTARRNEGGRDAENPAN